MVRRGITNMNNPNGPYPGRQLFIGLTGDTRSALVYLVTGRSPQSRERLAVAAGDSIRIDPIGQQEHVPLRFHYPSVKFDNDTSMAVVSNGIQTEAIFETYRLLLNAGTAPTGDYLGKILDGAGAEPDSLNTPRIAGVITSVGDNKKLALIVGIVTEGAPANAFEISPEPGVLTGISTYSGDLTNPEAFDPSSELPRLKYDGKTAKDLTEYLFDISEATNQGEDIRVCAIGAILSADGNWNHHIINSDRSK
jgi:IMP cyclohydrolase